MRQTQIPRYGLVLELGENGDIIRTLHDPLGALFPSVSEVREANGHLFVASPHRNYIGVLKLSDILQSQGTSPVRPGTGGFGFNPQGPGV